MVDWSNSQSSVSASDYPDDVGTCCAGEDGKVDVQSWDYRRVPEHTASGQAHQAKADDGVGMDRASASSSHHVERSIPVRNGRVQRARRGRPR